MKRGNGFEAQLSFNTFEWLQVEKVASGKIQLSQLSDRHRLQLSFGVFPKAQTLLHLIADKSSKEDQSQSAAQIMALLESEHSLIDVEMTGSEEPDQFQIPILANE